jgi:hypothetical protein
MRRWFPLTLAAAAGCAVVPDEAQPGALGNGSFTYQCINSEDSFCPNGGQLTGGGGVGSALRPFPTVALGGRFSIAYFANDPSTYPSAAVQSVSSDFFKASGKDFAALRPGSPWFVAQMPNGEVLDIAGIDVAPIAAIQITDTSAGVPGVVGATRTFSATPQDGFQQSLAGVVLFVWTTSDPSVLSLPPDGVPVSSVQVLLAKAGTATLSATSQGVSASVRVTVVGL